MASKRIIIGFIVCLLWAGMVVTTVHDSISVAYINATFQNYKFKINETRNDGRWNDQQATENNATARRQSNISINMSFPAALSLSDSPPIVPGDDSQNAIHSNGTSSKAPTVSSVLHNNRWTAEYYSLPSPPGDGRTTVIICSSLIPSHPSIWMINRTIDSIAQYVVDLEPNYELIVAVDGLKSGANQTDAVRLSQYVESLCSAFPRVQIVGGYNTNTSIRLSQNIVYALNATETEFVYLLQHDMPFRKTIDHAGLSSMARDVADQYPFNVRFNKKLNGAFGRKRGKCFNVNNQLTYHNASGLKFLKTSTWSDNNQFGTTIYYRRMFETQVTEYYRNKPMEYRMQHVAEKDSKNNSCLGYAQYLYGPVRDGPYIDHLDGRHNEAVFDG